MQPMPLDLNFFTRLSERLERLEAVLERIPHSADDDVLTTTEAARILRIGQQELREMVHAGEVPCYKRPGSWRFSRQQLLSSFRERAALNVRPDSNQP